jgi:flagellar FliL protein
MADEDFGNGAMEDMGAGGGKSNMMTIIIIAAIAIVMGAGGFFAGKMLSDGEEKKNPVEQKQPDNKAADTNQQGQTQPQNNNAGDQTNTDVVVKKSNKGLLALETFTVNLNDPFGRRYIEVVFNLIVEPKNLVPKIKENELLMPKIRHEVFMTVSAKSYAELKSTSGKVTLCEEIMMRVNEILKEEMGVEPVTEVLHTKFLIQ